MLTYIHTDIQTDRQTDRQTVRQTDRQTDRQIGVKGQKIVSVWELLVPLYKPDCYLFHIFPLFPPLLLHFQVLCHMYPYSSPVNQAIFNSGIDMKMPIYVYREVQQSPLIFRHAYNSLCGAWWIRLVGTCVLSIISAGMAYVRSNSTKIGWMYVRTYSGQGSTCNKSSKLSCSLSRFLYLSLRYEGMDIVVVGLLPRRLLYYAITRYITGKYIVAEIWQKLNDTVYTKKGRKEG